MLTLKKTLNFRPVDVLRWLEKKWQKTPSWIFAKEINLREWKKILRNFGVKIQMRYFWSFFKRCVWWLKPVLKSHVYYDPILLWLLHIFKGEKWTEFFSHLDHRSILALKLVLFFYFFYFTLTYIIKQRQSEDA